MLYSFEEEWKLIQEEFKLNLKNKQFKPTYFGLFNY